MELNYYTLAKEDQKYLEHGFRDGVVSNVMCAISQNICERYLKQIIEMHYAPSSLQEEKEKENLLHTHNLKKLMNFLSDRMGIEADEEETADILGADGYYFTTRYPGDDAFFVKQRDIDRCRRAVETCKAFTDRVLGAEVLAGFLMDDAGEREERG